MDYKTYQVYMKKIFRTFAFTSISAVALITASIVLYKLQRTEIVTEHHEHKNETKFLVNYADCVPVQLKFNTCEEVIETKSSCNCDIDFNLDQNLQGKVSVYSQIDKFDQVDSTVDRLFDMIEDTFEKCNLSTITESTHNFYCKPIPDNIFNDTFTLRIYNTTDESIALGHFSKSNSLGNLKTVYENLKTNRQDRILTVSMETDSKNTELENGLGEGKYHLKMTYRPRTYKNTARVIVFSTERMVTVTTTHTKSGGPYIISTLAFIVGNIFGFVAITSFILIKRLPEDFCPSAEDGKVYILKEKDSSIRCILEYKRNNVTHDLANDVPTDHRDLETLEEKPLSSTNNDT